MAPAAGSGKPTAKVEHRYGFTDTVAPIDETEPRRLSMSEHAAKVAPHIYKVMFENDRLRVLEVRMKPGDESAMHSHPAYLVYALTGGKVKMTSGNGESGEVDIASGDAMWREAEEHSVLNTGTTELTALFIEPK